MGDHSIGLSTVLLYVHGTGEEGRIGKTGEHGDVGAGSVHGGGDSRTGVYECRGCYGGVDWGGEFFDGEREFEYECVDGDDHWIGGEC
jgi:hypothetical protein